MLFRVGRTDILEHIATSGFVSLLVGHGVISVAMCSPSSCFLARILDNPCPIHKNGGVLCTPPRSFARPVLSSGCGLRDLGGNAPEDHGCGLLNSFQALSQQVGVSVPNLDVISGGSTC